MVEKRPGEEFDDCSVKQPRYSEPGDRTVVNLDTVDENASHVHHYLGHEGFPSKTRHQYNGRLNNTDITDAELLSFTNKEIGRSLPGSFGNSSWVTSEENIGSDAAFRILLSPDYYNDEDHHVGIIVRPRVLYYSLLDIPPQKTIPLGIDFQAEIPEFGGDGSFKLSISFGVASVKFAGTCVIPMAELEVGGNGEKLPGSGRTDCFCEDIGSIRCVKQHVEESRVTLRTIVGNETFCKLGLDEMGEVVAEKWSEEEREIFHEVIYSNPESLGMNFWDQLAKVFPLRTKKEIVSYYFNVFILRKRADQNRCNVRDIDSDNDELESSEEVVLEKINKDDDSVSESQGAEYAGNNETYEEDHANENFVDQERTSDDMVDQSIVNPSSRFALYEENEICIPSDRGELDYVQNGCSDIYCTGELDGPGLETGTCNTHLYGEEQGPDCPNGDCNTHVDNEQQGPDCPNGVCNTHVDCEQQGPDCQNGVSALYEDGRPAVVTSEKANCDENQSSKDGDEHDPQAFRKDEGFLLSTSSVIEEEVFTD